MKERKKKEKEKNVYLIIFCQKTYYPSYLISKNKRKNCLFIYIYLHNVQ